MSLLSSQTLFFFCFFPLFLSSLILFKDLSRPLLKTESQKLSVGSRRNDESSVTRVSRARYSSPRGDAGRAAAVCAVSAL